MRIPLTVLNNIRRACKTTAEETMAISGKNEKDIWRLLINYPKSWCAPAAGVSSAQAVQEV